jgi:hypothetical protein
MDETIGMAAELRERFDAAALFYLEAADHGGRDITEAEDRLVKLYHGLSGSVDAVPPGTKQAAEAIKAEGLERFWQVFDWILLTVGPRFSLPAPMSLSIGSTDMSG